MRVDVVGALRRTPPGAPDRARGSSAARSATTCRGSTPAGRPSAAAALPPASSVSTTAQAPSEDGHDSRKRIGSHIIGDSFTFSIEMSSIFRWAYGFFSAFEPVLDRDLPADVLGRAAALDVGADERGERAAGAERRALAAAEGELGVALRLLLEGDGEHASCACPPARGTRRRWRWCRRPSRRCAPGTSACRPRRARRRGRARASSRPRTGRGPCRARRRRCRPSSCARRRGPGTRPRARGRRTRRRGGGTCGGSGRRRRSRRVRAHDRPSRMQIRFCCRHGPRRRVGRAPGCRRRRRGRRRSRCGTRPVAMIGFDASAPPDGLTATSSPSPSTWRSSSSSWVNAACSSATSTGPSPRPAASAAMRVDGESVEGPERRVVALGAVVEAGDVRRPLDQLAGPVAGGQHHGGGAVGDRREVVAAQRLAHVVARSAARRRRPCPGTAPTPRPSTARRRCRRRSRPGPAGRRRSAGRRRAGRGSTGPSPSGR